MKFNILALLASLFLIGCVQNNLDIEAISSNIANGAEISSKTEALFAVALLDQHKSPFCSGTLIDSKTVITAAHCVMEKNHTPTYILIGTHFKGDTGERAEILRINFNLNYSRGMDESFADDMATLILKSPIQSQTMIYPKFATQEQVDCLEDSSCPNPISLVIGFGSTEEAIGKGIGQKRVAEVFGVAPYQDERFLWTPYQKSGARKGDSGGGLYLIDEDDNYYFAGIFSRSAHKNGQYSNLFIRSNDVKMWIDSEKLRVQALQKRRAGELEETANLLGQALELDPTNSAAFFSSLSLLDTEQVLSGAAQFLGVNKIIPALIAIYQENHQAFELFLDNTAMQPHELITLNFLLGEHHEFKNLFCISGIFRKTAINECGGVFNSNSFYYEKSLKKSVGCF